MKKQKSPNQIPEAHLEEDKASPGDETGEQVPDPSGQEGRGDDAPKLKLRRTKVEPPKTR